MRNLTEEFFFKFNNKNVIFAKTGAKLVPKVRLGNRT